MIKPTLSTLLFAIFSHVAFGQAPASPNNVSVFPASGTGSSSYTITWSDQSANETNFVLYRSEMGGPYTRVGIIFNQTSYVDTGRDVSKVYKYAVSSAIYSLESDLWYQSGNASTPSSCGTVFCYPEACSGEYGVNIDYVKTIEASCSDCQLGIDFSRLQLDSGGDALMIYDGNSVDAPLIATYNNSTAPTKPLIATGKKLTVRFKTDFSRSPGFNLGWSLTTSCHTRPNTPTDFSFGNVYSSLVQLKWTDTNSDELNYEIEYGKGQHFANPTFIKLPANTTSHVINNLDSSSEYSLRVRATIGDIKSYWSYDHVIITNEAPFRRSVLPVQTPFSAANSSYVKMGDMNSDKLQDFVAITYPQGNAEMGVFLNNGSGPFTYKKISDNLIGSFVLYDIDHDKDLDIVMMTYFTGIAAWINNGSEFAFKQLISFNINANTQFLISDYNNDGYEDILLSGIPDVRWFRNNRHLEFSPDTINIIDKVVSKVRAEDLNNDGLSDLLLQENGNYFFTAFLNSGAANNFRFIHSSNYDNSVDENSVPVDFDDDGDTDFLGNGLQLSVNQDGSLLPPTSLNESQPSDVQGANQVIDWDGDGDMDVIYRVAYSNSLFINIDGKLYQVTNFAFDKNLFHTPLPTVDWDDDGDIDLVAINLGQQVVLWKNEIPGINKKPNAPTVPAALVNGASVQLSWQKATDDHTQNPKYNFFISRDGDEDVRSSMAFRDDGKTKLPGLRTLNTTSIVINDLKTGNYTWGVQSIDASDLASSFVTSTFKVVNESAIESPSGLKVDSYAPYEVNLSWTDNSDNETEFVILRSKTVNSGYTEVGTVAANQTTYRDTGLKPVTLYNYRIYARNTSGESQLSPIVTVTTYPNFVVHGERNFSKTFPTSYLGDMDWSDLNKDGRPDITVAGTGSNAFGSFNYLEVFTQNGSDPWSYTQQLLPLRNGYDIDNIVALQWQDFDRDGDFDLGLLGVRRGTPPGSRHFIIIRDDRDGYYSPTLVDNLGIEPRSLNWGDFDNDGDQDILVGVDNETKVYFMNDPALVEIGLKMNLPHGGASRWTDFDNDGDLDIVIANLTKFAVYENTGSTFALKKEIAFSGNSYSISVTDADRDGDEDYLVGNNLIENDRVNDNFIQRSLNLTGGNNLNYWVDYNNDNVPDIVNEVTNSMTSFRGNDGLVYTNDEGFPSSVSRSSGLNFADIDNDGDLDFFSAMTIAAMYYENWGFIENKTRTVRGKPQPPVGLSATVNGNTAKLSWVLNDKLDNQTYNVAIGTASGKHDVLNPLSDPVTGYHRTNKVGNARYASHKIIKDLPDGVYFWSVQAIDLSYKGGLFSAEQTFVIGTPPLSKAQITSATALSSKHVKIEFTNTPQGAETTVFVSENGVAFEKLSTTTATSQDFYGKEKTTYFFRIIQKKDGQSSEYSEVTEVTTLARPVIVGTDFKIKEDETLTIALGDIDVTGINYPEGYKLLLGEAGENYSIVGNEITPEANFFGTLLGEMRVANEVDTSDVYHFTVEVESVNDAPGMFDLISPSGRTPGTVIDFFWTASEDVEGDELNYTLVLTWSDGSGPHEIVVENILLTNYGLALADYPELVGMEVTWRVTAFDSSGAFTLASEPFTFTIPVREGPTTGVNEYVNCIYMYPNPVSKTLYLEIRDRSVETISVFDMKGSRVYSGSVDRKEEVAIDVSEFMTGLYVVNLTSSTQTRTLKFIKR